MNSTAIEPEDYATERLAARAATYRTNVARLRALVNAPTTEPEEGEDD